MVFESIVADLLNRYLGEYVENLDKGQLKIGIWGGKARQSALLWIESNRKIVQEKSIFLFSPHSLLSCLRFIAILLSRRQ